MESVSWPSISTVVSIGVVAHQYGIAVRRESIVEEVATPPGSSGAHLKGGLKNNVVLVTISANISKNNAMSQNFLYANSYIESSLQLQQLQLMYWYSIIGDSECMRMKPIIWKIPSQGVVISQ